VPASAANTLAQALRPVLEAPAAAGVLCDVDGTLAAIVERSEDAQVPQSTARLLGALARRYALVACVSGRGAQEARRIVGVGGIAYVGAHGAELLPPAGGDPEVLPAFASWRERVHEFARAQHTKELRLLRIRVEDKGPIVALHWRGVPDEAAARTFLERVAIEAEGAGLAIHWGRKVLELRPPVAVDKGMGVRELVRRSGVRVALFAGDDVTDLDAFAALDALVEEGALDAAVRVGVSSPEAPPGILERADVVVEGVPGFAAALDLLARDG
jgi:trehalose 6-phosphate phosphatase